MHLCIDTDICVSYIYIYIYIFLAPNIVSCISNTLSVESACRVLRSCVILGAPESPWLARWAGVQAACDEQVHQALVSRFAGVLQGGQSPSLLSAAYPERQGKHQVRLVAPYAMHADVLALLSCSALILC